MHPRLRRAAFLAILLSAQGAWAAPQEIRKPPMGDTLSVEVWRGRSANITLKAYEGRNNPLAYEIDRQPRHGTLAGFQQADANRQGFASVVYTHGNDEESYEDDFTYRARALGGGVSSPIKVKIRIMDEPPRLDAPSRIEFSAVAGESDLRLVGLTNAGGAILEGSLRPEQPFYVDGDGRFRLGRGQSTNIAIRFSPTTIDSVPQQKLTPAPADPSGFIVLSGQAKEPFAAEAALVELNPDGSREGTIIVTNYCAFPARLGVTLRPEGAAESVSELEIAAGGTGRIPVRIGAERKSGAFDLVVRISDQFHGRDLTLQVPAVPPQLELLTPELDFRNGSEASLEVRNSGGVTGRFTLELPPGVQNLERAASIAVPPGESAQVGLRLESKPETADSSPAVVVDLGLGGKIPVPVLFTASEPERVPLAETNTAAGTPVPPPPPPRPWKLNEDVKLQNNPENAVMISWISAKDGWDDARLEVMDEQGARTYRPEPASKTWWQQLTGWWSERTAEAKAAIDEKREFFENRNKVPGEEEPPSTASEINSAQWREIHVAPQDLENSEVSWRIVARQKGGEFEAVSQEFRPNANADALEAFASGQSKPLPPLPGKRKIALPLELPIKPVSWTPSRDGATITFEIPAAESVEGYRFERMQRLFGPDPETGYARVTYEGQPFTVRSAELVSRKSVQRNGIDHDEVTVRFSGMESGEQVFWRAIPLVAGGKEQPPSGILHFWTLSPPPFPVRSAALALCAAALVAVLWLRWKARRAED